MGARNAGNPHVACDVEGAGDVVWVGTPGHTGAPALDPTDERGWETERCRMAQATAPILDSTIPEIKPCTSPASVNANLSLAEPLAPAKDYASDHSQVNTAMR